MRALITGGGGQLASDLATLLGRDACVFDREALDILRRASPFPAFPAAKPGTQDAYIAPVNFAR